MRIPIWKRLVEFFAFTYFNWAVVVPSLIPFMILWVRVDETQLYDWIYMSVFTSLYIGWLTVKVDSKFAPWFYRLMKMTPPVSKEQEIVNRLKEWRDNIRKPYNLEENPRQIDESSNIDLYLITKIDKILDEEK